MSNSPGTIYLVPTPIGNMGDITQRAVEVLSFNEAGRAQKLVEAVQGGLSVAVITDGGSPGISDPAYRVVRAAIDSGLNLVALYRL